MKKLIYTALSVCALATLSFQKLAAANKYDTESGRTSPSKARPNAARPNIIFILTDDQRWDALGYAGNKLAHTPEMDKLASEGVYFRNGTVTTPICSASRASILSGMYERVHRYTFQTGNIKPEFMQQAYPKMLKNAGYYTAYFGKFGVKYDNKDDLFNEYEDYDRMDKYPDRRGYYYKTIGKDTVHLTRYTGYKAVNFIKNAPKDKPFCLSIGFSAPHAHDSAPQQYFWDKETDGVLQNTTIPDADISDDAYFNILPEAVKKGFNRLRWTWRYDTPEKYQQMVKGYYRMIAGVDLEIAKIRQELEQKGIADNTIIILMGDNGFFLGERQLAGKWLMYDNSIRVPLIIYDPRNVSHKDVDQLALNIDIAPTILDFAGVKTPEIWQGKSLVPVVRKAKPNWKRTETMVEHLWEFENIPPSEGITTRYWKYFRYVDDKSIEELYDLKKDPKEINNLAANEQFRNELRRFRKKTNALSRKNNRPFNGVPQNLMVKGSSSEPNFSWTLPPTSTAQTAYQVLVASSKSALDNNIGDIWDSGQTKYEASEHITYRGKTLTSGISYYWKVRIWDEVNRTGDYSHASPLKTSRE